MKQWIPSQRLLAHCKDMENPNQIGRNSVGIWKIYVQGGYETVGYGHEITREEKNNGVEIDGTYIKVHEKGLSDSQVNRLLEIDLAIACLLAQRAVAEVCEKTTWCNLHERAQEVCTDYVFKMGSDFFQE